MPSDGSQSLDVAAGASQPVVAIKVVAGSSKAEEWGSAMLQAGDVVEEIKLGDSTSPSVKAPFKGGRSGVQKLLHQAFKRGETSIHVRARRGQSEPFVVELQGCLVPHEGGSSGGGSSRRQYVIRSIHDPNYAVGFIDSVESECIALQGSRSTRVVSALSQAQLQDGYVSYPWEKKMREELPVQSSSCFLSLLILPKALNAMSNRYNSLEDTLARANAWLFSTQASGVPIVFMNVQIEALLTKISGETASATVNAGSLADLSNLGNASLYGFEDYHGVDIGVVRAVRLWYTPVAGELPVEINLQAGDSRLGFAISRTEEGFIYISSVTEDDDPGVASTRSGLRELYREATRASKRLVISRVSNEKILPWMVSSAGAIRCFDTVSLSKKLSLHRHALRPILIHVLLWERPSPVLSNMPSFSRSPMPMTPPHPPAADPELVYDDQPEAVVERGTAAAGDTSFRFTEFGVSNNWV